MVRPAHGGLQLCRALFTAVHILPLALFATALRPRSLDASSPAKNCQLQTWTYQPSKLEQLWTDNVHAWGEKDYCVNARRFREDMKYWLRSNERFMRTSRRPRIRGRGRARARARPQGRHAGPDDRGVFSAFVKTFNCSGASETWTFWVEPLAFSLRHPIAPCDPDKLVARGYLLLASQAEARMCSGGARRTFLFDLGASTYKAGMGGPSQSFLIDAYKRRGIQFDRILLWEATPHAARDVYDLVPRELHAAYQYINIPIETGIGDPGNPLSILKSITTPEDFVSLKLDIDTPHLEADLVNQILDDPEVYSRIDEFFFEHHVNFGPMLPAWRTHIDRNATLASSYSLFLRLRQLGIRAHGWP